MTIQGGIYTPGVLLNLEEVQALKPGDVCWIIYKDRMDMPCRVTAVSERNVSFDSCDFGWPPHFTGHILANFDGWEIRSTQLARENE